MDEVKAVMEDIYTAHVANGRVMSFMIRMMDGHSVWHMCCGEIHLAWVLASLKYRPQLVSGSCTSLTYHPKKKNNRSIAMHIFGTCLQRPSYRHHVPHNKAS